MKIDNKYIFAGLDFIVDSSGKLVFVEANSFPGLLSDYKKIYGKSQPLIELTNSFKGDTFILVYTEEMFATWREPKFLFRQIMQLTSGRCRLVLLPYDWRKKWNGELIDVEGNSIEEGFLWTPLLELKNILSKNPNFNMINSYKISNLTRDKLATYKLLSKVKGIYIPRTWEFKNKKQLKDLLKINNLKSFAVKPRYGQKGEGVVIADDLNQLKNIRFSGEWLLQEKIEITKYRKKIWDIRAFVVHGKYVGAVKRISHNPVVNVSLGGSAVKIDSHLKAQLKIASEKIVRKINSYLK